MGNASQIIQIFLPFFCMGDEASDIWYAIENWNNFKNDGYRIACIFFIVFPFLLVVIYAPI